MKKKIILIGMLFVLFFLPYQSMAQQKIEIDNPVFIFESVPEGVHVLHEFIIKNTGDTLLHINNVLPP